jgi:hypothetical protein
MNYLLKLAIPLTMFSAMVIIIYYIGKEYIRERRTRQINDWFKNKRHEN